MTYMERERREREWRERKWREREIDVNIEKGPKMSLGICYLKRTIVIAYTICCIPVTIKAQVGLYWSI
jgi:hypothetical protein